MIMEAIEVALLRPRYDNLQRLLLLKYYEDWLWLHIPKIMQLILKIILHAYVYRRRLKTSLALLHFFSQHFELSQSKNAF